MTIHHLAYAKSGEFITLQSPILPAGEHGSTDENGITLVHITTPVENGAQWLESHYWNGSTIVDRGTKPSVYSTWDSENLQWTTDSDALMIDIRGKRSFRLKNSDWTQLPDNGLTEEQVTEAKTYRQALRDVPANNSGVARIEDVVWPTKPSFL